MDAQRTRPVAASTASSGTAGDWHGCLKARYADRVERIERPFPFSVTRFRDLPRDIHQPALLDDIFCLHLGGAKRVHRLRDGSRTTFDVPLHAVTLMPRHRGADWRTEGPDDYLHITLAPRAFNDLLMSDCGLSRDQIELRDDVGEDSPLLTGLAGEMLRLAQSGLESRLYVDTLFTAFALTLVRRFSERAPPRIANGGGACSGGMSGWRLRQVVDFMTANLADEIDLSDLTRISGLSRAHFFRSFRQATGTTPGRYLERLRVDRVRRAIERGERLEDAAPAAGFSSQAALSASFRRVMRATPRQYRAWYR